jgi:hypothetical protein
MQRIRISGSIIGIAFGHSALAENPAISLQALGTTEAFLNFCAKVDCTQYVAESGG